MAIGRRTVVALVLAAALGTACAAPGQPDTSSYHPSLAYTRWVPDARAMAGPEPGFRPQFTGLTGADVASATPAVDATGTSWVLDITFTARGKQLFAKLTKANVEACPGDPSTAAAAQCAQRHLTVWLDLTQTDLDSWDDPTYAAHVSSIFDLKCLARNATGRVCGKLVTDPITIDEIDGGAAQIGGAFTQESATELANALNSRSR